MAKAPKTETKATNGGSTQAAPAAAAAAAPAAATAGAAAPAQAPSMKILGQYLKDMSFENPNAPQALTQTSQPEINISVNVNAKPLAATDFEVELHIDAKASAAGKVVFAAEVLYAGVFRLENIPQEALHPIVLIECPRMIFPFARQIIADATRNGGFPPLMLDPIDFAQMFQQKMAEDQAKAKVQVS